MAHNLSQFNGSVTMAYAGETPWHHLGKRLPHLADVNAAMIAAGLDWTVTTEPVYLADGRIVPERNAVIRNEDRQIFGTVGDRFKPIQNGDAFHILDSVIQDAGVTIESAGALGNGATVWMLAKFPTTREITPGDKVNPYFLIFQAHDGSKAYGARLTPIRVVCQNTLTAALGRGYNDITIRHTASAPDRLTEAKRLIERLSGMLDQTVEVYQSLASVTVSNDDLRSILTQLFPIADTDTTEVKGKQLAAQASVAALYTGGVGSQLSGNTAWGVYNAVTEYVDHVVTGQIAKNSKSDARKARSWESAIFGPGDRLKAAALTATRQLVAA